MRINEGDINTVVHIILLLTTYLLYFSYICRVFVY